MSKTKEIKLHIDHLLDELSVINNDNDSAALSNRLQHYNELFNLLKQNIAETNVIHYVSHNLWKFLQILVYDITKSDHTNPFLQKAFSILGFLAHNTIISSMFSAPQIKQFFSLIFSKINSDKKSCALSVWCLGSQQFHLDHLAPFMLQIFEALNLGLKNPFHSQTALLETMKSLSYLLNKIHMDDVIKYADYWLVDLIKIASTESQPQLVSEKAKSIIFENNVIKRIITIHEKEASELIQKIPSTVGTKLYILVNELPNTVDRDIWQLLCLITTIESKSVNKLAQMWKSYYIEDHIKAIESWSYLVFALRININKARIQFLAKPIANAFQKHANNQKMITTSFQVWSFLVKQVIEYSKNLEENLSVAFDYIKKAYSSIGSLIQKEFANKIADLPKTFLEVYWKELYLLDDLLIKKTLAGSFLCLSSFADYLSLCILSLQKSNDISLLFSLYQTANRLLTPFSSSTNTEDKKLALEGSKLRTLLKELLLFPVKHPCKEFIVSEFLIIWKEMLLSYMKFISVNTDLEHPLDLQSIAYLKFEQIKDVLDEILSTIKYWLASSVLEEKGLNIENFIPFLDHIIDELNNVYVNLVSNTEISVEKGLEQIYELAIFFLEKNIAEDSILKWCELISPWKGFGPFLQKISQLKCAEKFAKFWSESLPDTFSLDILTRGLQSTSKTIQNTTIQWFQVHIPHWNLSRSDISELEPYILKFIDKTSLLNLLSNAKHQEEKEELSETLKSNSYSDVLKEETSLAFVEPIYEDECGSSLLDLEATQTCFTSPSNSIATLRLIVNKNRPLLVKRSLEEEKPQDSLLIFKKRKISNSKFVLIDDQRLKGPEASNEVTSEKEMEQQIMFEDLSLNPINQKSEVCGIENLSSTVEKSPSLIKTPSTRETEKNSDEELEILFSDLDTGCSPENPILQEPTGSALPEDFTLMQEQPSPITTATQTNEKTQEECVEENSNPLNIEEIVHSLNDIKSRIQLFNLLESTADHKHTIGSGIVSIQKEAIELVMSCSHKLDQLFKKSK